MPDEDLIGRSLNRYKITSLLGSGGIGSVYKAQDAVLQRDVAIKVMKPEFADRPNFRDRFLQEARLSARLDHPSIVKVYDFGQSNGLLYIVMEYIPGENMRKMLQNLRAQKKWVLLNEAVQIVEQVSEAIQYCHSQGVLHRDIKPDNLMLKPIPSEELPYRVVITDLGLAQLLGDEQPQTGRSSGTPAYMSPEQAMGHPTDARSDVYSLGVLLFELAVGRLPFPAFSIPEAIRYHTQEPVPSPRSIRPDLPPELDAIIMKALQKDPNKRYSDAGELAKALHDLNLPGETEVGQEDLTQTVSLTTQYDVSPAEAGQIYNIPHDFIDILAPGEAARRYDIRPGTITIGRESANDIVLDSTKVSRQHARVQFDGNQYWVTDLNSKNGTYLGSDRLPPGQPVAWPFNQTVKIGGIQLVLRREEPARMAPIIASPSQVATQAMDTAAVTGAVGAGGSASSQSDRVGIFMETMQLSALPGSTAQILFTVLNRSASPSQFRVSFQGLPQGWIPAMPPVIQLPPGGQQEVRVTVHPPQTRESRPGRYPFTVRVTPMDDAAQAAQVDGILSVGTFSRFASDMRPGRLYAEETTIVTVQNLGNARESFTITPSDRFDELAFDPPQARMTLAEGETAAAEFRAYTRRRALFGSQVAHPFSVQINTPSGRAQAHNGEVISSAIFPVWVLPLLLTALLCAAVAAAYGYYNALGAPLAVRQTESAQTQSADQTQSVLALAGQATIQAATQNAYFTTLTAAAAIPATPTATPTPTPTYFIPTPTQPTPTLTQLVPTNTSVVIVVTATTAPSTITPTPTNTVIPPTPTLTSTPANTVAPIQPSPTPLGGSPLVYFSTVRDGNYEIYVMLPDGSKQTRITNNASKDFEPALSPDGKRVAFVSDRDGTLQVYTMNLDGSGQARLSNNGYNDYNPAWSPDSSRIVFTSDRPQVGQPAGTSNIFVMSADGSNQTPLTTGSASNDHPTWSPDGAHIAFDSKPQGGNARLIMVMSADGSNQAQISNNNADNYQPSYSPDGTRITFISNKDGAYNVYIMNADGSNQTRVSNLNTPVYSPHFSRDGKWIVFSAGSNGTGGIFIIDTSGNNLTNLTNSSVDNITPTW